MSASCFELDFLPPTHDAQSAKWRTRQDLNLQPFDPKSNALSN
jgi:hypothetical protein